MTTTAFLASLQLRRAHYCLRCPAIKLEWAAEEATELAATFSRALIDGTLVDMDAPAMTVPMTAAVIGRRQAGLW